LFSKQTHSRSPHSQIAFDKPGNGSWDVQISDEKQHIQVYNNSTVSEIVQNLCVTNSGFLTR